LPRPGVARELPFKRHFKGEAKLENQLLKGKLGAIEDLSVLRKKRHVYTKAEKRVICTSVNCFNNRELARRHLHIKKGIFLSSGWLSNWMAQFKFGMFLPAVEPNRQGDTENGRGGSFRI
jgi:hypothetical protein